MKKFNDRRQKAIWYINLAIDSLDKKNDDENIMRAELKDIAQRIDDTIIYFIKDNKKKLSDGKLK